VKFLIQVDALRERHRGKATSYTIDPIQSPARETTAPGFSEILAGDQGQTLFFHTLSGNDGGSNAISVDYIVWATTAAEKKATIPWVSSKLFRVGFEPMIAASGKTTVRFSPRYKQMVLMM